MTRLGAVLAAAAVATLGTFAVATPASAKAEPILVESDCLTEWYVNPDEGDRLPESTEEGLIFQPADLVHHLADLPLDELEPGTYEAAPVPDQPSFFSVEVRSDAGAYGTLRWDPVAGLWSITIGAGGSATAGTFTNADPVVLLVDKVTKWGTFVEADITVVSFGVGYTKNPPGTVETTVSSVTFADVKYPLTCAPPVTETTTTVPAATTTTATVAVATLPVTGAGTTGVILTGAALVIGGAALIVLMRKRRDQEQPQQ